jgi:hypothetical protein
MKKLGLATALVVTLLAGSVFAAPVQNTNNSAPSAGSSTGMKHHRHHRRGRRHHRRGRRAANTNT